ncbi:MAG: hypothetical protein ACHQ52_14625 [Candidatus Eisenbacteria bacterium]
MRRPGAVLALAIATACVSGGSLADPGDSTRVAPETVAGGHSWLETTHIVPPPQPPLIILGENGVTPVRDAFRGADGTTRVVLLMSPT